VLNPGRENKRLRSKGVDKLKKGDVVRIVTPGGGGFGDPQVRSSAFLAEDLVGGKVTEKEARTVYGEEAVDAALRVIAKPRVSAAE
jgi:N-methylhydantoinase B